MELEKLQELLDLNDIEYQKYHDEADIGTYTIKADGIKCMYHGAVVFTAVCATKHTGLIIESVSYGASEGLITLAYYSADTDESYVYGNLTGIETFTMIENFYRTEKLNQDKD